MHYLHSSALHNVTLMQMGCLLQRKVYPLITLQNQIAEEVCKRLCLWGQNVPNEQARDHFHEPSEAFLKEVEEAGFLLEYCDIPRRGDFKGWLLKHHATGLSTFIFLNDSPAKGVGCA